MKLTDNFKELPVDLKLYILEFVHFEPGFGSLLDYYEELMIKFIYFFQMSLQQLKT